MGTPEKDLDTLVPETIIFKVMGEELRLAPLPNRRLLEVVRFIEKNFDVLSKAKGLGEGLNVSTFLEDEVLKRLNELMRLLFWNNKPERFTDEWCGDNLSLGHYRAIGMAFLRQNELYSLFQLAKGAMAQRVEAALRQTSENQPISQ